MSEEPAAQGGRWIELPPERLARWLADFDERHRVVRSVYEPAVARFEAADGAIAECHPSFPPLASTGEHEGLVTQPLLANVQRERVVGVLLARLGGHAAGVFEGDRLVASKVGSRPVHGRNAAGGWSQGRFARRREGQTQVAAGAAADDAARVLVPRLSTLQAVVLGGDRRAVDPLREDPRLQPVFELALDRFLTVPDPKLAVLSATPRMFRAVRIQVTSPPPTLPHSLGEVARGPRRGGPEGAAGGGGPEGWKGVAEGGGPSGTEGVGAGLPPVAGESGPPEPAGHTGGAQGGGPRTPKGRAGGGRRRPSRTAEADG